MPRETAERIAPAPSVTRAVAQFALAGLLAIALFLVGAWLVLGDLGRSEALRDARELALLSGQGIVEPELGNRLASGDPQELERLDRLVQERVLGERIVRIKIWTRDGRVLYSDEPRLVGSRYPVDDEKLEVLRTGTSRAELSDLAAPENRYEQGFGELYEVYLPIRLPDGTPLVFETYQRGSSVVSAGRRVWVPFAGLLLASLLLLWLVQIPLAWRLARGLRRSQEDRELLLTRSIEASADERRRIAASLHDGVVQDLAGIAYSLNAAASSPGAQESPEIRKTLRAAAAGTRDSMRRIRSLLVQIHPPNLRATGLEPALSDLLSSLPARGIETTLEVPDDMELDDEAEALVYRAANEALRNVERHAEATHVTVRVSAADGRVRLEVWDDGVGFTPEQREESRSAGHVGLSLLEELAERQGGSLDLRSAPGAGTAFVLEVPAP